MARKIKNRETAEESIREKEPKNSAKRYKFIFIFLNLICLAIMGYSIFLIKDDGILYWGYGLHFAIAAATADIVYSIYLYYQNRCDGGFTKKDLAACVILTIFSLVMFLYAYRLFG